MSFGDSFSYILEPHYKCAFTEMATRQPCWSAESCRDRSPPQSRPIPWQGHVIFEKSSRVGLQPDYKRTESRCVATPSCCVKMQHLQVAQESTVDFFLWYNHPSFARFLLLALILNLHTWLCGVLLVEPPTKDISPPPSSKTYNPSFLCEAVSPQQEHWRFNFHKRLSCLLHHLNFLGVWSWNLCRFSPVFVLSISLKKGAVKHQQQRI